MAKIDLAAIQPHKVSRGFDGKSILIYGEVKTGKTTVASQFPNALLMAFEAGFAMLNGVRAVVINDWTEALDVKRQLLVDARKVARGEKDSRMFDTIVVDTADQAYQQCEKFVCDSKNVQSLSDIPYGGGFALFGKEFDAFFQDIVKAGYGLVVISHSEQKEIDLNGETILRIQPSLPKRGLKVLEDLVDVLAYADPSMDAEGNVTTTLVIRGSRDLKAGSRFAHMSVRIPFSYEALRDDMARAVDRIEELNGKEAVTDDVVNIHIDREKMSYEDVMKRLKELHKLLSGNKHGAKYQQAVERRLGKNAAVSDCNESQIDVLIQLVADLEALTGELGLVG